MHQSVGTYLGSKRVTHWKPLPTSNTKKPGSGREFGVLLGGLFEAQGELVGWGRVSLRDTAVRSRGR